MNCSKSPFVLLLCLTLVGVNNVFAEGWHNMTIVNNGYYPLKFNTEPGGRLDIQPNCIYDITPDSGSIPVGGSRTIRIHDCNAFSLIDGHICTNRVKSMVFDLKFVIADTGETKDVGKFRWAHRKFWTQYIGNRWESVIDDDYANQDDDGARLYGGARRKWWRITGDAFGSPPYKSQYSKLYYERATGDGYEYPEQTYGDDDLTVSIAYSPSMDSY